MWRPLVCLAVAVFLSASAPVQLRAQELMIYSDEYRESVCALDVEAGQLIDIWLWAHPGDEGLRGVELSTVVSDFTYLPFAPVYNPDVTLTMGSIPDDDLSVTLSSCHTDWVWIAEATLFVQTVPEECASISIHPWTDEPYPKMLNCSYEEEPALVTTSYLINCVWPAEYYYCDCRAAEISRIDVDDGTHITMHLDCPTSPDTMLSIENYSLCERDNPGNTIPISGITCDFNSVGGYINYYYIFALGESIMPGTTYTLSVGYIDSWVDDRDGVEFDFAYTLVATLLQDFAAELREGRVELSWSMSSMDDDVEFAVSRRSSGGEWAELPADGVERDEFSFIYMDDGIEPDESYVYRVDYTLGTETALLFQTDAVETPAMPLALEQNVPNPFNPSTEISYYLPAAVDVRLEVYDISGRLITRLADGLQPKGWQRVHWDGTDTGGCPVASGVYFYRLRAGKEVVSKKMVMLR